MALLSPLAQELGQRWAIWGLIATIVPLRNLYFMVFKP